MATVEKTPEQWLIELQPFFKKWEQFLIGHCYGKRNYDWWYSRLTDDYSLRESKFSAENQARHNAFFEVFKLYKTNETGLGI